MNSFQSLVALVGRLFISLIFIFSGYGKITGYSGTAHYMQAMGVPGWLLPLVILTELGGGIAILLGYKTRVIAFLMAGFTLLTALIFHSHLSNMEQYINFMKNIAIAGGFLFLVAFGAGRFSLDKK